MRTKRWMIGMLALVATTAAAAQAWPTKEERDAVRAQVFAQADADGSGALSAEELATFKTLMRQRVQQDMFGRIDANGDGQVSLEELQAARPPRGGCHDEPEA